MKVNISRLHNMLEQINSDVTTKQKQINEVFAGHPYNEFAFTFPILLGTTDDDLQKFLSNIDKKRSQVLDIITQIRSLLKYRKYIREILTEQNAKSGVSNKLMQVSILQKEKCIIEQLKRSIASASSSGLDEIKNVSYYKSSFTDDNKSYDLKIYAFQPSDVVEFTKEIEDKEREIQSLNNEIAFTNQTTVCEISSFEDYISGK